MKKKKPFADEQTRKKLKEAFKQMKDRGETPFKDMDNKESQGKEHNPQN